MQANRTGRSAGDFMRSTSVRPFACAVLVAALSAFSGCGGGGGGEAASDGAKAATGTTPSTAPSTVATAASAAEGQAVIAADRSGRGAGTGTLVIRAHAQLAGDVGPRVEVRIGGAPVGSFEVRATEAQDFSVPATGLVAGAKVELVYVNDAIVNGQDRNLFVAYVSDGRSFVAPSQPGIVFDRGPGPEAFDGQDMLPGTEAMRYGGALRFNWPAAESANTDRDLEASRFLQQASFGPTYADIGRLSPLSFSTWIDQQMAMPVVASYVPYIQGKYDLGAAYLPLAFANYTPDWLTQKFWFNAVNAPDQLRKRTAHALHSIFVTSLVDSNLFHHARAHAQYLDTLDRLAFGNFRELIEEIALSPVMGIYLSHIRNQKEDAATNRLPDENFARELMQLFTIGLYELNPDGSPKLDARGLPIETYNNADVMAMAKVFTGWSWGFDSAELTTHNFHWSWPDAGARGNARVDLRRMKPYPGMHSSADKRLFAGKPNAVTIPGQTAPADAVKIALDTLFRHPNVGPFIGRQLIQRLVTSNPSAAYVQRVGAAFDNNGQGVRGDLGAVVRAVLLDPEARTASSTTSGKLREPVLRLAHSLRALGASSASGEYLLAYEPTGLGQRAHYMPSVFGYFRPGYVPPQTLVPNFAGTAPEFQLVDEASTANWVNAVELMFREGLGWHGSARDVTFSMTDDAAALGQSPEILLRRLELLLFSGRMPAELRKDVMDAMQGVAEGPQNRDRSRAKVAALIALTSPEYLIQH